MDYGENEKKKRTAAKLIRLDRRTLHEIRVTTESPPCTQSSFFPPRDTPQQIPLLIGSALLKFDTDLFRYETQRKFCIKKCPQ